ncbi:MAG TPA: hypothetical protein VFI96_03650 [Longimicrobiaceae bacterium]|nr:hypothetical protein [Longimicrobiaceae bacterium]
MAALVLAAVNVLGTRMRFIRYEPRSRWLSFAGGVSVAYVFVHLLPELAEGQRELNHFGTVLGVSERHVYLIALLGLAVFYGLERLTKTSKWARESQGEEDRAGNGIFWIHMASFSVYNLLIGYLLLHRERNTLRSLTFFAVAMALHFLVNDFGLQEDHKEQFHRIGRWIVAAAVLAGWAVGVGTELSRSAIAVLIAFLAGGVILNVLKEEVPKEHKSRFWAFAAGLVVYSALLLVV